MLLRGTPYLRKCSHGETLTGYIDLTKGDLFPAEMYRPKSFTYTPRTQDFVPFILQIATLNGFLQYFGNIHDSNCNRRLENLTDKHKRNQVNSADSSTLNRYRSWSQALTITYHQNPRHWIIANPSIPFKN